VGSFERFLGFDHGLDTVVHVLHKILLRAAKTSLVGDIEDGLCTLGVLTMDTTDLDVVLVSDFVELGLVRGELWQPDVDGCTESSAEVGWAGGNVAVVIVVGELGDSLDCSSSAGKTIEDSMDVSAWLHRDDSELILLIDPDKEGLVVVVEDSSSFGPVAVQARVFQETVTLPKIKKSASD